MDLVCHIMNVVTFGIRFIGYVLKCHTLCVKTRSLYLVASSCELLSYECSDNFKFTSEGVLFYFLCYLEGKLLQSFD